jgi:hypothetical protein
MSQLLVSKALHCQHTTVSCCKVSCIIPSNFASNVTDLRISVHTTSDVNSGSYAERAICVVGLKNVFDPAASIEHLAWLLDTMLELSELLCEFQNIKYIFYLSCNCIQRNNMWDLEDANSLCVIFCSDLLFQILYAFAVLFHSEENCYSCCNLREELELYKQFLPALSREWKKNLYFCFTWSDFSDVENLKNQES